MIWTLFLIGVGFAVNAGDYPNREVCMNAAAYVGTMKTGVVEPLCLPDSHVPSINPGR